MTLVAVIQQRELLAGIAFFYFVYFTWSSNFRDTNNKEYRLQPYTVHTIPSIYADFKSAQEPNVSAVCQTKTLQLPPPKVAHPLLFFKDSPETTDEAAYTVQHMSCCRDTLVIVHVV